MKILRIALFFIFGTFFTLHSFSQEIKKEKKAKIKMEVTDDEGNKKVIDTVFTVAPDQDFAEIMRQIKEKAGFSEEEIAKMQEFKMNFNQFAFDAKDMMMHFTSDSMPKHMMIVREEMSDQKENLQKALEGLKVEIESLKMNEEAMKKLEKAMEMLREVEWKEHAKQMKVHMEKLHKDMDKNISVIVLNMSDSTQPEWVDKDGEKRMVIRMDIEGDSLDLTNEEKIIFIEGDFDEDQKIWTDKNGKRMIVKTGNGNQVFFGDEKDLELIEDGENKIIVKKLREEAAKGDAIFISDDAHIVKNFKDEDGNVRVVRLKTNSDGENTKEVEVFVTADENDNKNFDRKMLMISPAGEKEMAMANEKGILDAKAEVLRLGDFTFNVNDQTITLGTTFEKKGKLDVKLFDAEMNKIWERNAGNVSGEWSTEIPSELMKNKGVYYFLFTQGKKIKLFKILNN